MKIKGRNTLLIIDNCTAHPVIGNLTNIEVAYLPPNTTSQTQPCDQGIIQALRHRYRMKLLTKFIEAIDNQTEFRTTVLDAIVLLKQAWDEVSSVTVANYFRHSGFVHDTTGEAHNLDEAMDDQDMKRLWKDWAHYYHRTMQRTSWMSAVYVQIFAGCMIHKCPFPDNFHDFNFAKP